MLWAVLGMFIEKKSIFVKIHMYSFFTYFLFKSLIKYLISSYILLTERCILCMFMILYFVPIYFPNNMIPFFPIKKPTFCFSWFMPPMYDLKCTFRLDFGELILNELNFIKLINISKSVFEWIELCLTLAEEWFHITNVIRIVLI